MSIIFELYLSPFAAYVSVSDLHPGEEQPAVCWHDNQPDHLDQQPQPAGLRLQTGETEGGRSCQKINLQTRQTEFSPNANYLNG